jgi:hypothetical protein
MNLKELTNAVWIFVFMLFGLLWYITMTLMIDKRLNVIESNTTVKTDSVKYDYTLKFKGCDIYTEDSLSVDDLEKISRCIEYRIWSKTNGGFKKQ